MGLAKKPTLEKDVEKITVCSYLFTIYLIYVLIVWGNELVDIICFTVGIEQVTLISRIIVLGLILGLLVYTAPKVRIIKVKVNVFMLVGTIILLVMGILKSVYPDTSYDTLHYHLINQRPGFMDYFVEHFAKGNFQIWGFRLGDRLFYSFRSLLGYRLGTLLNTVVLIILYIQINELLKIVNESKICRAVGALLVVLIHDAVLMIGTYCVDILPLPIALEVLRKLLEASRKKQNLRDIWYFAFLNGIWFAFKMTNIVFVAPCVLIYIFLARKQLSLNRFIGAGLLAALPCSIYLLYAYQCTGNPIFPYFNALFQSDFFSNSSFKDLRWGGINIFEKLFWLTYMIVNPNYRQSEIPNENTLMLGVGLLGILLVCFGVVVKKRTENISKEIILIVVLLICGSLVWSFSTGYSRYFIFGMLLLGIMAYYCLLCFWKGRYKFIVWIICPLMLLQTMDTIKEFYSGREWSWTVWTKDSFMEQSSMILDDKEEQNSKLNIDMFFLTNSMYSGIADMVDCQAYTFNASYSSYLDSDKLVIESLQNHHELTDGDVYDIYKRNLSDVKEYIQNLNTYNMTIQNFEKYDGSMGTYELIKIKYSDNEINSVYVGEEIQNISLKSLESKDNAVIKMICGRIYDWEGNPICMMAISKNNREISRFKIDDSQICNYEVDLGSLNEEDVITINLYHESGEAFENQLNEIFIINPVIE